MATFDLHRLSVAIATICIALADHHAHCDASSTPKGCVSVHGDAGTCMTPFECRLRKGVQMKTASAVDGDCASRVNTTSKAMSDDEQTAVERVCCYLLPCSRSDIRMEVMETVFKLGLHNPPSRFRRIRQAARVQAFDQLMVPTSRSAAPPPAAPTMSGFKAGGACGLAYFGPSLRPRPVSEVRRELRRRQRPSQRPSLTMTTVRLDKRHRRPRPGRSTLIRSPHIVSADALARPSRVRFPWLMSLWMHASPSAAPVAVCAATLIHPWFAVTAAHCLTDAAADTSDSSASSQAVRYTLLAGTNVNRLDSGLVVPVRWARPHPDFNGRTFEHDVAVLKLARRVWFTSRVSPMCLPQPADLDDRSDPTTTDYSGETVYVAGWGCLNEACTHRRSVGAVKFDDSGIAHDDAGDADDGEAPADMVDWLRHTKMTVIDTDLAMCWFMNNSLEAGTSEYIPDRVFVVAGDESGARSTCRGDSGASVIRFRPYARPRPPRASTAAPFAVAPTLPSTTAIIDERVMRGHWEMIGIVSWSRGCGRAFRPSVWTRVESYVTWIRDVMDIK